jgi:putative ABC transport system ATP-binding protein
MTALLQARGVVRSYGKTPAVRGVTLSLDEGEIVAVTGPSGCGKSTVLHCLAGILRPDAGDVSYRGERIDSWSEARRSRLRRTDFGVLFQFGQLVSELSSATTWLDRLGVSELGGARPGELSGGEQQRVALARALVTEPRILFADEPTGALDSLAGEKVLATMVRLAREQRTAVLLVTHDARVAGYADREIPLRDGQLDPSGMGQRGAGHSVTSAAAGGDR